MIEQRRQRRKLERPGEILEAAQAVFAEKGFTATKLEDIARRAGVSKGTLYIYYKTKEDLFREVAKSALSIRRGIVSRSVAALGEGPGEVLEKLVDFAVSHISHPTLFGLGRMLMAEAANFPELAKSWHDEIAMPILDEVAELVAASQSRGYFRAGDPRFQAVSILGPLILGHMFHDRFAPLGGYAPDITLLARQHVQTLLSGWITDCGKGCEASSVKATCASSVGQS